MAALSPWFSALAMRKRLSGGEQSATRSDLTYSGIESKLSRAVSAVLNHYTRFGWPVDLVILSHACAYYALLLSLSIRVERLITKKKNIKQRQVDCDETVHGHGPSLDR